MKKYILLLFWFSGFAQFNPVQWYEFGGVNKLNINNLIFYLKFNADNLDSSIVPKTTFIQNSFTYQDGLYSLVPSNCVLFNSINQIVTADNSVFSFGDGLVDSDFSLALIIKPSSDATRRTLIAKGDFFTPGDREYLLELQSDNTLRFLVYDESATAYKQIVTSNTFTSGNVYDIDAVYSSGLLYLYADGVLQSVAATNSGTYTAMENNLYKIQIGKHLSFNAYNYSGNIDEVQVWKQALSQEKITYKHNLLANGVALRP